MKKIAVLACIAVVFAFMAGCGGVKSGKMLVEVNGTKVTEGDLEFLGTVNPRIQAQIMNPEGKKRLVDNLIEQELLYQEAVKEGVNRKPDVKAKIDLYRRVIIAQALVDDEAEKMARKYYDEHPEEFKKIKLSQILIRYSNPDELKKAKEQKKGAAKPAARSEQDALKFANEIKARLDKGEDFAKVAKEVSDDTTTKSRGGDLGLATKSDQRLISRGWGPLLDKAYEMKVGEIAGPIKTNNGYHIITVTQGVEVEPYDEARAGLEFKFKNGAKGELVAKLKKDAKIEYAEGLKPETKPAEGAAPAVEGAAPIEAGQPAAGAPSPGVKIEVKPAPEKTQ